jgi:predicted methyltransferase
MRLLALIPTSLFVASFAACSLPEPPADPAPQDAQPTAEVEPAQPKGFPAILASQPADVQARYNYRHPAETMEFFGVAPGMTVVDVLPGGGWYTKLLLPYLGDEGKVIGTNYATGMWKLFGYPPERLKELESWADDWTEGAQEWRDEGDASVSAFVLGDVPDSNHGSADVVLFIRALHNMARFEEQGGFLNTALKNAYDVLKPGGVVGIVQHRARDDMPDEWADGSAGYLKESYVTDMVEAAGFELMGATDINANDHDQPTTEDFVWRLPPTFQTSRDDQELQAQMIAIGESNRMTLKFRKPTS